MVISPCTFAITTKLVPRII